MLVRLNRSQRLLEREIEWIWRIKLPLARCSHPIELPHLPRLEPSQLSKRRHLNLVGRIKTRSNLRQKELRSANIGPKVQLVTNVGLRSITLNKAPDSG